MKLQLLVKYRTIFLIFNIKAFKYILYSIKETFKLNLVTFLTYYLCFTKPFTLYHFIKHECI